MSAIDRKRLTNLYAKGKTPSQISEETGVSIHTVRYHCLPKQRNGVIRYNMVRRKAMKSAFVKYSGGKCLGCSYDKFDCSLEFHHIYEKVGKKFNFSNNGGTPSFMRLWKECDKTLLLCRNCHSEIHWAQRDVISLYKKQKKVRAKSKSIKQLYLECKEEQWAKLRLKD